MQQPFSLTGQPFYRWLQGLMNFQQTRATKKGVPASGARATKRPKKIWPTWSLKWILPALVVGCLMVVSGSRKRWDRWHSPSPNWQYIPLIYHLYTFWGVICYLHSLKFNSSPLKIGRASKGKYIVFQPSFFRGELLNFGGVQVHGGSGNNSGFDWCFQGTTWMIIPGIVSG